MLKENRLNLRKLATIVSFLAVTAMFSGCDDKDNQPEDGEPYATPPVLTTAEVTGITATSATAGGNITDAGTPAYTGRGVCFATTASPTVENDKIASPGSGTGSFNVDLATLTPNTTYYVRAYATGDNGTVYGNEVSFTTLTDEPEKGKLLEKEIQVNNGYYAEYEYDAQDRLTKFSFCRDNGELVESFTLIYDDNDLVSYVYDYYEHDRQTIYNFIKNGNTITIPGNTDAESGTIDLNTDGYPVKFENESGSFIVNYQYQGGNMTKMSSIETWEGGSSERSTDYKYDNGKSLFYNCKTPKWFMFYLLEELGGQNNVIERTVSRNNGDIVKYECAYEFDSDGYPVKKTEKYHDGYDEREFVVFYEYK